MAGRSYDGKPDIFTADNILDGLAVGPAPFIPRRHKGFDGTPDAPRYPVFLKKRLRPHLTGTGSSAILAAEAAGADEIIAASLVNAEAAAKTSLPGIRVPFRWSLWEREGWKCQRRYPVRQTH